MVIDILMCENIMRMNDNFKIICRTCMLETNNGKMLNEKVFIQNSYIQLSDIIIHCAAVEIIMGDELPYILCRDCVKNAVRSYNFRQKCEESDKKLREVLIQQPFGDDEKLFADMDDGLSNDDFNPDSDDMIFENVTNAVNSETGSVREIEKKSGDFQIRFQKLLESQVSANQDHGYNNKKLSAGVTLTNTLRQKVIKKTSNQKSREKSNSRISNSSIVKSKEPTKPRYVIIQPNVSNTLENEDTVVYNHTMQKGNNATEPLSIQLQSNVSDATNKEDTVCRVCLENVEPDEMKAHITIHKEFRCASCKLLLVNYHGLRSHQLYFCKLTDIVNLQGNFSFDLEDEKLPVVNKFSFHDKVEIRIRKNICRICGNKFDTRTKLSKHYCEDHLVDGVRRHVCNYCGRILTSANGLRTHLRIHTGERPFPCSVCDKAFNDKSCLNSHMLLHTPLGTRELYECAICGHKNQRKGNLRIHLQTHAIVKAFKCIPCSKEFKTRVALKNHTQTHLGRPRIHVCDICEKDFDKRTKLINHIKLHTGERPHTCEFCGKGFIQRYTLREHYKSRHPHAYSA